MGSLANRADPDEMPQNVAYHQDLHCLPRNMLPSETDFGYIVSSKMEKILIVKNYIFEEWSVGAIDEILH